MIETAGVMRAMVPLMKRPVVNPELGTRVRNARKALGISQIELAERVGEIGQSGIAELESGRVRRPSRLRELARALSVTEEWLLESGTARVPTVRPTPNAGAPEYVPMSPGRIPVYGHAAGSDNGRFVMNGQKITDVFCPPILAGVRGAYAVYVHGDSMIPRYEAGETVWLHPYLPVKAGDYVVAQIRPEDGAEGEPPDAYVKRFVSRSQRNGLLLEQLNPPDGSDRYMQFEDDDVFSVHKIVFSGIT